ncbi:SHLD3 protein, partial [Bombycilla garrulus]|nr:SHLD3 protein [Bombycilla garrulus]
RQLPRFAPWFPNYLHRLPLKPKKQAPVISYEEVEELKQFSAPSEYVTGSPDYDCTKDLLEFHSSMKSWSVSLPSAKLKEKIHPLPQELQNNLERLKLHVFCRAKWIIEQSVCKNQNLEDIWIKLNRLIKQNELPSCNVTIQRSMGQIWIFCDILYCEYVRNILRENLSLTDKINLLVHKYGIIFSL